MKLDKTKVGLASLAVLAIFSILAWLFWGFIRDVIVIPIYYLVWVAGLVLKSTPQGLLLALLVVVCSIIAWNTLQKVQSRPASQDKRRFGPARGGRYLFWSHLFTSLHNNPFVRTGFALEVKQLIQSILAYQEGVDFKGVEQMVADKSIEVPSGVEQLILSRKLAALPGAKNSLPDRIVRFARQLLRKEPQDSPVIDEQAEEILRFIEYRLEIRHKEDRP